MPGKHFSDVSFYIVAHADDWQLFMYPNVYNDIMADSNKTVFIITTAGDAGRKENYWLAREEGAKSSLRYCLASSKCFAQSEGRKVFNGHSVYYWCADNAAIYFMRLPDGNLDGSGFPLYNFQSTSKLKSGKIKFITAVDNSTRYNSWADFFTTLEAIVFTEADGINKRWLHYLNPDEAINPKDHADHTATGEAVQCLKNKKNLWQVLYAGYNVINTAGKLKGVGVFWKAGMFTAYDKAVFDNSGYSTLQEGVNTYLSWCLHSADFIVVKPEL